MKNNVKNPLTVLLLSFFISACAFSYCNATVKISAIFVAVIAVILIILIERIKRRKLAFSRIVAFIMLGTVLSGALSVYAFDYRAEKISRFAESMDTVTIKITDCDYALSYTARYTAKIVSSDLLSSGTSILITTEMTGLKDGTLLRGEVV